MGKEVKRQKRKRLWHRRSLWSLGIIFCLIGIASIRVSTMLEQRIRYQQAQPHLQCHGSLMEQQQQQFGPIYTVRTQTLGWSESLDELGDTLCQQARVLRPISVGIASFGGLVLFSFGGLVLLLLPLLQRDRTGRPLIGQLVLVLPEECVAELTALHQRLKKQQLPSWLIRFLLVQETLKLMWVIHIQIKFDNLWLPRQGNQVEEDNDE